eukprot:300099-Prymnesium_polylepis.1
MRLERLLPTYPPESRLLSRGNRLELRGLVAALLPTYPLSSNSTGTLATSKNEGAQRRYALPLCGISAEVAGAHEPRSLLRSTHRKCLCTLSSVRQS